MILLAADIENSRTELTLLGGLDAEPVAHWQVATSEHRSADEWAVLLRGLLEGSEDVDDADLDGIAVCSTVPAVLHEWRAMLERHFGAVPAVVVGPGVRTGLAMRMDNPREVGADRIMNALAAGERHPGPVVVVDLATATTFDVVDAEGRYVGGAIAPGLEISLDALRLRAAQLRQVELVRPRSVIARNTVEALQSGVLLGVAAQVDGMVERILEELDVAAEEIPVVATGPLAALVVPECRTVTELDPWLTARGLWLVFERNS